MTDIERVEWYLYMIQILCSAQSSQHGYICAKLLIKLKIGASDESQQSP